MVIKTKKIVAIGGGVMKTGGLLAIDKEIVRLSGKKRPKLLFLPTASSDSELYWFYVNKHFGKRLGCKTDVLYLIKEKLTTEEIKNKILSADIIYVGGGNTLKMMRLWRRLGVDKLLKQAWRNGTVLCGISAGSICWFESGHSDSMSFYSPKNWKYINVQGLGFIKGIHCPHYDSETLGVPRKNNFRDMIKKIGGMGIAIDNNCAIAFLDNQFRIITSKENAKAYRIFKQNGKLITRNIPPKKELMPLKYLFLNLV
ncbi:MAG TPA: peptidase E [Candidatus Nanoarchaeia archaeon]|nr:peptidase E [Candidatus Nanoarchaeia archaeon]